MDTPSFGKEKSTKRGSTATLSAHFGAQRISNLTTCENLDAPLRGDFQRSSMIEETLQSH